MDRSLLDILVDPLSGRPLELEIDRTGPGGDILAGRLLAPEGRVFPVKDSIPRFVLTEDPDQRQTEAGFAFKWRQESLSRPVEGLEEYGRWLFQRYGFDSAAALRAYFAGRRLILDAGCGNGFSTSFWMTPGWRGAGRAEYVGADISAAVDVARERLGGIEGTHFLQADLMRLPFRPATFDTIFAEGVLHHTPSTRGAVLRLAELLESGGEMLFYVYRRKGPLREFADDYIRGIVSGLSPQEAAEHLRSLTSLAKALAELKVEVEVPEDVPLIGLKAGRHDLQRLIYYHFAKLFWSEELDFEANNLANFDWYYPRYAHRQTEAEVRAWCAEAGLTIQRFDRHESGFTVRAIKA